MAHKHALRNNGELAVGESEQTPLLGSQSPQVPHNEARLPSQSSGQSSPLAGGIFRSRRLGVVSACVALILLIELGAYLATIPLNQVLEENICRIFHHGIELDLNDARCKDKAVQKELTLIRGWQNTFELIPSLLLAVPYGLVADRYSRELVLSLSILGITLSSAFYVLICALPDVFPPRLVWISSIFNCIGGGTSVFNSMIFTITGDVVTEQQRSTTFFYLGAAVIGGQLVSSPLVYILMKSDLWLAILLGLGCLVLSTILSFFLPETLRKKASQQQYSAEGGGATSASETPETWLQRVLVELKRLGDSSLHFAKARWQVLALLFTLLVTTFSRFAEELLMQYVTKRYNWSWAQASLLLFVRAFFNLGLCVILLPAASYVLVSRWSLSGPAKDLWLAHASVLLLTGGAFIIGLAATSVLMGIGVGIFALGSGYTLILRSLLASVVDADQIGRLYAMISVLETVGALISGPLLAAFYRVGLDWGGPSIGLPYLVAGCLFCSATLILSIVRLSGIQHSKLEEGDENPLSLS